MFAESAKRFAEDTTEHHMTVLHEAGAYRHLLCKKPGTCMHVFELVTWPGALTINGDMGTFTFARDEDMFTFFGSGTGINPGYWSQKVRASSGVKEYSEEQFKLILGEYLSDRVAEMDGTQVEKDALVDAVREEVYLDPDTYYEVGARTALDNFEYHGFRFDSASEWDLERYTAQFLWCCHAIRWGITQYRQQAAVAA